MSDAYATLLARLRDIGILNTLDALLEWDQNTQMPPKGVTVHAEAAAFVAGLRHERRTSPEMGALLARLDGAATDPVIATNVREARRLYARAVNVPTQLVEEIARTSAQAKEVWADARRRSDFAAFAPYLSRLVDLKREQADAIGYADDPYDALMDEFEPGASTRELSRVFAELRQELVPLVRELADAPRQPDFSLLKRPCPQARQERICRWVAKELGFDFEAGRMDVSVHPFCTSIGCGHDVRVTTRFDEQYFPAALFGVMHEIGHGLYEQGLDAEHMFTPMGTYCSVGIHESQSRMWENFVGRSRGFWQSRYPAAQEMLGDALAGVSLDAFCRAINTVAPSLIRVEADEVTYNLHIIVRFELEREIINKRLRVRDIPEAWNARYAECVGVTPANDAEGCLQDIHWSLGAFGYFPTYALGNLYAAHLYAAACRDVAGLEQRIAEGDTATLLAWLREKVHRHGMRYQPAELCALVTGSRLDVQPFLDYVRGKFRAVYGLA